VHPRTIPRPWQTRKHTWIRILLSIHWHVEWWELMMWSSMMGIIRLRSRQIICVSYLWVVVEGWHDIVVVVGPHPIMSHGRRKLISQWSRQNVLSHFKVEAWTQEYFKEDDQRAMPWLTHTVWAWSSWSVIWSFRVNQSTRFPKPDGLDLIDSVFADSACRWWR
jgi:hypothetical protein